MLSFLNYLSKSRLFINKTAAIFTTVLKRGRIGIMFVNEFIIPMLNPLVVVDFRFICIPACIMSSEFTLEREQ